MKPGRAEPLLVCGEALSRSLPRNARYYAEWVQWRDDSLRQHKQTQKNALTRKRVRMQQLFWQTKKTGVEFIVFKPLLITSLFLTHLMLDLNPIPHTTLTENTYCMVKSLFLVSQLIVSRQSIIAVGKCNKQVKTTRPWLWWPLIKMIIAGFTLQIMKLLFCQR